MKKSSLISYTDMHQALKKSILSSSPAELHGIMCGILCGQSSSFSIWTAFISEKSTPLLQGLLATLYAQTISQLNEFSFEFNLFLPTDSKNLALRAESLSLWCQGFLTGLKMVNIPIEHQEQNNVREALNDLIAIANMNYEDVSTNEEDEIAYMELVEYIRMAVILIYQQQKESNTSRSILTPTDLIKRVNNGKRS